MEKVGIASLELFC